MTHIAVAGAGIGGLVAALALARAGIDVTVLERRPAPAEFGAGLQLSPNATRILRDLDLLDAIRTIALEPQSVRVRRGRDAADLVRFPLGRSAATRYGAPFLLVLRPALQRLLAERADGEPKIQLRFAVEVDKALPGRQAGVSVPTATNSVEADGFVDARGVGSSAASSSGRVAWRALVPAGRLRANALRPDTNLWLGPKAHLVHYPVPDGTHVNVVAVTRQTATARRDGDELWSRPGDPAQLFRAFAGWHADALRLLDLETEWRCWPLLEAPPRPNWSNGSVTVLGDAAHPMLPFLAQGASQAIEDAAALAACLGAAPDVTSGFAAYERQRLQRATRVQTASRHQADIYHLGRPASDARDLAMRLLGGDRALARMDWLYGG